MIEVVEKILMENPATRENDNLLIAYVLKDQYGLSNTFDVALMTNANLYESIGRARRKLMERNPSLRPSLNITEARMKKEAEYRKEMRRL